MNFKKLAKKYLKPVFILAGYKIIQGIFELAGSLILLSLTYLQITELVVRVTREELLEDPKDIFVALLFKSFTFLSNYQKQSGIILLVVGIYDVVTGLGLFFEKNWARTIILAALMITLPYNAYELFNKFDVLRLTLLILQTIFIYILWKFKPKENKL